MGRVSLDVAPVQGEGLRLNIFDQPDRVVGFAQGLDHRLPDRLIGLHLLPFFRDVGDEDIRHVAVGFGFDPVAVILHPPGLSVLSDDPVFHVIHPSLAGVHLPADGFGDHRVILRMDHSPEGVSGQLPQVFHVIASVNVEYRPVRIQEFSLPFRSVDKEAAGHMAPDLLDNGERLLIQQ